MPAREPLAPFVSGLPGPDLRPPASLGPLRMLAPARALLVDQIDELSPLCLSRWDGVERQPADEVAIAKREALEGLVAMIDAITGDQALIAAIALRMVKTRQR